MDAAQLAAFEGQMQDSAEALWPETITIDATAYACAAVVSGQTAELVDGGIGRMKSLTVTIRKSILASLPVKGTTITHAGEDYRFDEGSQRPWFWSNHMGVHRYSVAELIIDIRRRHE